MDAWLHRRIHPSWLIACLSLGVIIGIAGSAMQVITLTGMGWVVVAIAAVVVAFSDRRAANIGIIILAGLILGTWRGGIEQAGLQQYKLFYGKTVQVQGTVSDDASYGSGGEQRLMLKNVRINGRLMNGQIWVSANTNTVKRSDTVTLTGKLGPGFGSITASVFTAHVLHIKRPTPGDIGLAIRDWFAGGIRMAIPEPEASLASGYLVGQRSSLPADLDSQMKIVGLTHVVVASGYNLTILVSLARQVFLGVSKYLATLTAAGMIAGFIMISGLSPSMARAGLVASLTLAAWYYGRKIHPFVLLALAAAVTAFINPFYVWGDIGWYLSFTSFAGVIVLAPLIHHAIWRSKQPNMLAQLVIDTMAAQVATLPIMVFAFGHYSPYALLANLLVLPLIPITMLLTFIAGVAGLIIPGIAHLVGLPATLILHYNTSVVATIADLPGAQGDLAISLSALFACYACLAAIIYMLWHKTGYHFRESLQVSEKSL